MDFDRLRASTIPGLLLERARARPREVAFRAKELGVYRETSWAALASRVAAVAQGLASEFGIGRGASVAIVGNPCPEWTIADLAAQALGAVTYGVYPTSARPRCGTSSTTAAPASSSSRIRSISTRCWRCWTPVPA